MPAASHRIAGSLVLALLPSAVTASAQAPAAPVTDSNTPLHLLKPDYPVPYGPPAVRLRLVAELAAHYRAHPLPEGPLRSVLAGHPVASRDGAAAEDSPLRDQRQQRPALSVRRCRP